MTTGYEVKMYANIDQIAQNTRDIVLAMKSLERSILIAGLLPTILPIDLSDRQKLVDAARAVDDFLEGGS